MTPTLIPSLTEQKIRSVCSGKFHSLFVSLNNELFSTGGNSFG